MLQNMIMKLFGEEWPTQLNSNTGGIVPRYGGKIGQVMGVPGTCQIFQVTCGKCVEAIKWSEWGVDRLTDICPIWGNTKF